MATTTPNFGWPVPTSTDLVKDGATAIEALGDAIDASLVDLEGGTTGQILAKASNTDMDFAWITNDVGDITAVTAGTGISGGGTSGAVTVTNSMATAIDAKGDLIGGTGADAFARLAVGANDTYLIADSAQTTGLAWSTGGYTAFTPTGFTGFTLGNGTATGRYRQFGKTVFFHAKITLGSTSVMTGPFVMSFPVTANTAQNTSNVGIVSVFDNGVGGFTGQCYVNNTNNFTITVNNASGTYVTDANFSATVPMTWTTNDAILINGTYEAA